MVRIDLREVVGKVYVGRSIGGYWGRLSIRRWWFLLFFIWFVVVVVRWIEEGRVRKYLGDRVKELILFGYGLEMGWEEKRGMEGFSLSNLGRRL